MHEHLCENSVSLEDDKISRKSDPNSRQNPALHIDIRPPSFRGLSEMLSQSCYNDGSFILNQKPREGGSDIFDIKPSLKQDTMFFLAFGAVSTQSSGQVCLSWCPQS